MASKRTPGSRPGLIQCDRCGEEYSSSYRRCPFCAEHDEYDDSYDSAPARTSPRSSAGSSGSSGGKRLAKSNRRGGGYRRVSALKIIGWILSLVVIVAAILVVFKVIRPLVQQGDVDDSALKDPVPPVSSSTIPSTPSQGSDPVTTPGVGEQPDVTPEDPGVTATDPSTTTQPSAHDTAKGFTLKKKDFSFTRDWPDPVVLGVTYSPIGSYGTITWTSSDPNIATVDENGKVSPGTQKGSATITATLYNGATQSCTVRNQIGSTSSSSSSSSDSSQTTAPSTSSYKINKEDFTFVVSGEKTQLKVNGYTGSITWSSSNTSVATVSESGICKAIGTGKCTIYATLEDGTKLEAIARVKLS